MLHKEEHIKMLRAIYEDINDNIKELKQQRKGLNVTSRKFSNISGEIRGLLLAQGWINRRVRLINKGETTSAANNRNNNSGGELFNMA